MASASTCKKCGTENSLGRIFCVQCGAKLDLDRQAMGPSALEQARGSLAGLVSKLVRLVILLGLLGLLGLMVWPLQPTGAVGEQKEAHDLYRKLIRMRHAIDRNEPDELRVTEAELNSFFREMASNTPPGGGGLTATTQDITVRLRDGGCVLLVRGRMGPVLLSYEMTGTPRFDGYSFLFDLQKFRLGHLTMPGPLGGLLADRVAVVFQRQQDEVYVLNRIDRWAGAPGAAVFYNEPK